MLNIGSVCSWRQKEANTSLKIQLPTYPLLQCLGLYGVAGNWEHIFQAPLLTS